MILWARFILPVDAPPIENGAIAINEGGISAVGPSAEVSGLPTTDFGDAVILPGLVNAHTHLELTGLRGKIQPMRPFTGWLTRLVQLLTDNPRTADSIDPAVGNGIDESLRGGVTSLGDITRFPDWTRPILARHPLRVVSFGEVIAIGSGRRLLATRLDRAASSEFATDHVSIGISPHAPYTVEPAAMRACADRAAADNLPLCIHLAETAEEVQFTQARSGPFVAYLQSLGVWDDEIPNPDCSPFELADRSNVLTKRTLIAHGNYVSDDDIALLAARRTSVAYCPRTHSAFGHPPHPFLDMIAAGVNVCIGTDSLASNPSLSLLEEMRFLREHRPDVDPATIIRMSTFNGALALGVADSTGSLALGKSADLLVLPLTASVTLPLLHDAILRSDSQPLAVFAHGLNALEE